jgi:hypothetical protein
MDVRSRAAACLRSGRSRDHLLSHATTAWSQATTPGAPPAQAGYREGLDEGKERTLQQGFDTGACATAPLQVHLRPPLDWTAPTALHPATSPHRVPGRRSRWLRVGPAPGRRAGTAGPDRTKPAGARHRTAGPTTPWRVPLSVRHACSTYNHQAPATLHSHGKLPLRAMTTSMLSHDACKLRTGPCTPLSKPRPPITAAGGGPRGPRRRPRALRNARSLERHPVNAAAAA